jgi:DNA invertase Pin-like site-specific DNA recombinase
MASPAFRMVPGDFGNVALVRKRRALETPRDDDIDPFTLHIYGALAEKERSLISRRTKEALAAAKGRDVVPGLRNPRIGAKIGNEAMAAAAARFAANVLPIIREIEAAGAIPMPGS